MPPGMLALLIVALMLSMDAVIVYALLRSGWAMVARGRGAEPIAEDAVRRDFQSFRFGWFNFGYCIHVAADERHLHLLPSALLRLAGAGRVSIPWEGIELERIRGRWATARVGMQVVKGPAWALSLAGSRAGGA